MLVVILMAKYTIDDLALCVEQITRRIDIPLSVDFERGYGDTMDQALTCVNKEGGFALDFSKSWKKIFQKKNRHNA